MGWKANDAALARGIFPRSRAVWRSMPQRPEPTCLEEVIDRVAGAAEERATVNLGELLEAVGRRSFGPLLLLAGVIAVSPLSGIPGIPTTLGCIVILIAVQLLMKRDHFWLPRWALRRSLRRENLDKAVRFMRRPARRVDRVLRERLTVLTQGPATHGIAVLCGLIALTMPPLEIVPFAASTAGAALSGFGLALIARDGLMAIGALLFTALAATLAAMSLG